MKLGEALLKILPNEDADSAVFWTDGKEVFSRSKDGMNALVGLVSAISNGKFEVAGAYGEEKNFSKLFHGLVSNLPKEPTEGLKFWATEDEILATTDALADAVADLLDTVAGGQVAVTGSYDREEDEREGTVDSLTGFHYVDIG